MKTKEAKAPFVAPEATNLVVKEAITKKAAKSDEAEAPESAEAE